MESGSPVVLSANVIVPVVPVAGFNLILLHTDTHTIKPLYSFPDDVVKFRDTFKTHTSH